MNNLSDNIRYSIQQYAALTQAQLFNSTQIQTENNEKDQTLMDPLQDNFNLNYESFPLLRMNPPQLHQPTIAKDLSSPPAFPNTTFANILEQEVHERVGSPIRVTRPPNAYLLFNKEMRKILKDQDPTMKVADISKEVSLRWKTIQKDEKEKYVKQANKLKEEQRALHPNSMYIRRSRAELVKAGHTKRSDDSKRKKPKRDKAIPKHPLSAYMWYLTEVRPETMRHYPGSNVGQISKLCAERWNGMTVEQRTPYNTKAESDKERYAREMQIYAIQNDNTLGRGTRQKYRSALASDRSFLYFNKSKMSQLSAPTSPTSILGANHLSTHLLQDNDDSSHSTDDFIVNNNC